MSTTTRLIHTGIVMGIVHVLTGPDHLSALATLSGIDISNTTSHDSSNKRCFGSDFLLGIKWGLGHSFGLLVVGGILIAMEDGEWIGTTTDDNDDDGGWSRTFEWFVGTFMLLLGLYGLHRACRNRREGSSSSSSPPSHSRSPSKENLRQLEEDDDEHDSIFEDVDGEIMGLPHRSSSGHNHHHHSQAMEIVQQMADVLNRDGDSMRGSDTNRRNNASLDSIPENPNCIRDDNNMDRDVEARILHAARSLRRNSDESDNDDIYDDHRTDDRQFVRTLRASSGGALSRSFVTILTSDRVAMNAGQFVHEHAAAPENSIAVVEAAAAMQQAERTSSSFANTVCCRCFNNNARCIVTPDVLALLAGIVHGVAGPGGVLGVIPAVQLRDARLASVYLSTFCMTSTLVMGCFAAFYGTFGGWLAGRGGGGGGIGIRGEYSKRAFIVEAGSACLSVAVGVVWLVLLTVGKLQEVFP